MEETKINKISPTQRAYTLRLRGTDPKDQSWRDKLWETHEAVNKGAKTFGDWLLTLRGGLSHKLVGEEEKKDRRIVLALSWLSVESEKGAPSKYIVKHDIDTKTGKRNWKTNKMEEVLREILTSRGVSDEEAEQWVSDCSASLSAAIRDDAVWVNRSKAFDAAGNSFTQNDIWDILKPFFGSEDKYLAPLRVKETDGDENAKLTEEEGTKDLVQKAGQWLSSRFGPGKGACFKEMQEVYEALSQWAGKASNGLSGKDSIASLVEALSRFSPTTKDLNGVLGLISGPGYKSATRNLLKRIDWSKVSPDDLVKLKGTAEGDTQKCSSKTGAKGRRVYSGAVLEDVEKACGFTYLQVGGPARHTEFAVMLDHAARRVSSAHTWIKRAEAERKKFEKDAQKIKTVPQDAKNWLDKFCEERSLTSGATEGYCIRKRAVSGWKEVVKAWSKADCKTEEDRIAAARTLPDEIDKFGDIQLFEALASDDAVCVWQVDGEPNPQPLLDYVSATDAEAKKRRFKVPAYRHPDPLLHPVFCDFGNSRWDIEFDIHERKKEGKSSRKKKAISSDPRGLKMGLFNGSGISKTPIRWSSKRFTADMNLDARETSGAPSVSRADRLGRAVTGVLGSAPVKIIGLFDQKDWNGRLQAPRDQLNAVARVRDRIKLSEEERKRLDKLISNIKWFITFTPKLQPHGPWINYATDHTLNPRRWPHNEENKNREGMAKHILSRLPGLRVLSVDLGHRYAAACAVWETIDSRQLEEDCTRAGIKPPSSDALYLHLKEKNLEGKDKTIICRRIGPDRLPDSDKEHPAPWTRLDRQFLIKLQGEEEEARKAVQAGAEIKAVENLETEFGYVPPEGRSLQVDELMAEAVRTVRLALKRHADRARIAHYLTTDQKTLPGGRTEKLDDNGRVELLTDALETWYNLAASKRWKDERAAKLWNEQSWKDIAPLVAQEDEERTRQQIKKEKAELRKRLTPGAEALAKNDSLRMKLHTQWATYWREEDGKLQKQLRWLRDWILPRGKKAKDQSIRHVGGLSLTRLATIRSLYQIQKAFFTRFTPDGRQMEDGMPVTAGEGFGQSILDALENMRENRVKQLASRIVEAALGVGRIEIPKKGKDPKRPCERVDKPCHAVVIENLTRYRPEETRTRRENRQLMTWSSAKVKKYLFEACQLHGLHLREVSAAYTSRQDSRTGATGVRCEDVPVRKFLESAYWKKVLGQAEKKKGENKGTSYDRYILDLKEKYSKSSEEEKKNPPPLRIPHKGGEVFVSADANSPVSKGMQADLNAAANIGLRALLDPDWPGRWWYVPCDTKTFKPVKDKVAGSAAINLNKALTPSTKQSLEDSDDKGKKKRKEKKDKDKPVINLWRDVSAKTPTEGEWQEYATYQNKAQDKVIQNLRKQMGLDK